MTHLKKPSTQLLLIIGIIFIAFNLRPSLTAIGPLIGDIRFSTGITNTAAGFLTTLPLLAFAFLSPLAPKIGRKLGNETTIFIGLILITGGILFRSTGMVLALFAGTLLLGLGIAIGNVLVPAIIKNSFPLKIGFMTGLFTASMGVMAALASGISYPIAANLQIGWEKTLAIWAFFAAATILVWLPQLRKQFTTVKPSKSVTINSSIWRSRLAWKVTLFMGFQSCIFYSIIAWLPEILVSRGTDIATAGWMLSLLQFAGIPASFIIPVLADRLPHQKWLVVAIGSLYLIGFTGLISGGGTVILTLCILFMGIAQGAGISLALTLFGLRSENATQAASLSGMAQSFGYFLAALGPIAFGLLDCSAGSP